MGIRGDLLNWIRAFLVGRKQRVCIGDDMSEWVNVTSGVPQGSVLGPLLFILYVNDSLQELVCGKIMFSDDVKLWQVIKGPNDQRSLQDNLHRLQAWSKKWLLDFNVQKCAALHLRPTNTHSTDSLRANHLKDITLPAESLQNDLDVWIQSGMKPALQCHKAAINSTGVLHAIKSQTGRMFGSRIHEHKLAVRRDDEQSQVAVHTNELGHYFSFAAAKVFANVGNKTARELIKAWALEENSVNRSIAQASAYWFLRGHLQSCIVDR
nr:unnamed protein product [Spirometra erinaceieuropaei]